MTGEQRETDQAAGSGAAAGSAVAAFLVPFRSLPNRPLAFRLWCSAGFGVWAVAGDRIVGHELAVAGHDLRPAPGALLALAQRVVELPGDRVAAPAPRPPAVI